MEKFLKTHSMPKLKPFGYIKITLILLLSILFFSFQKHEEYYSLTNIKYVPAEKSVQITIRFFSNDFEVALNKYHHQKTELNTEREAQNADEGIASYLHEKFEIKINNSYQKYEMLGKEFEKDVVYIYLEINDVEKFENVYVRNTSLFELYPVQEHITKIFTPTHNETVVLNAHLPEKEIFF